MAGVFPAGLHVGQLAKDPGGRLRVRLSADYERLEFLRVLRNWRDERITDPGGLVTPFGPIPNPVTPEAAATGAIAAEPADG